MEEINENFKFIKINKRKREDKKYLITDESRKKLKTLSKKFIIMIPYYINIPPITDENKTLFLYITNIITNRNDELLFMEKEVNDNETNKKNIKDFIISTFNLKGFRSEYINKILEIENKKISVYSINLGKKIKIINNFLITNERDRKKSLQTNELNLDLNSKYFKKKTFTNFYNKNEEPNVNPEISYNKLVLKQLNKINIYDDIYIEIRNLILFNNL